MGLISCVREWMCFKNIVLIPFCKVAGEAWLLLEIFIGDAVPWTAGLHNFNSVRHEKTA